MEHVLKRLDRRVERMEQILPALATKEDLQAFATKDDLRETLKLYATKAELRAGLQEVMAHSRTLFEQLRGDIQLLAGHVADISQRLPPRA